jgi:hypothetical protein
LIIAEGKTMSSSDEKKIGLRTFPTLFQQPANYKKMKPSIMKKPLLPASCRVIALAVCLLAAGLSASAQVINFTFIIAVV